MAYAEGFVGEGKAGVGDGTAARFRQGKTGEAVFSMAHGRLYEASSRGLMFTASVPVAGVAHGTAFGTTVPLTIYNPPLSGVNLALKRLVLGYVSGTLGAGFIGIGQSFQGNSAPSGTALVPVSNLLGSSGGGKARFFSGANSVTGTPTIVRPSFTYSAFAGAAGPIPPPLVDEIDDELIVVPGGLVAFQGIGTGGTTPLILIACSFEEVPIS